MKKTIIKTLLLSYLTIHGMAYAAPLPTDSHQPPQEDLEALRGDIEQQHAKYLQRKQRQKDITDTQNSAKAKLVGALVGAGIGLTTGNLYYHTAEAISDAYPETKDWTSARMQKFFISPFYTGIYAYWNGKYKKQSQQFKPIIEEAYKDTQQLLYMCPRHEKSLITSLKKTLLYVCPRLKQSLITSLKENREWLNKSYELTNNNSITPKAHIEVAFLCAIAPVLFPRSIPITLPIVGDLTEEYLRIHAVNKAQEALTSRGIAHNPTWMSVAAYIARYFHIHRDKDKRFGFGIRCNFFYDMPF